MKNKDFKLIIGGGIIAIFIFLSIVAIFYTPYNITEMNMKLKLQGPSLKHLFGTDKFGRDIFSRILVGGQVSFFIGISSIVIGAFIGSILGMFSGYVGGYIDEVIMRFSDALMAFPGILFALMIITALGPGITNLIIVISVMNVPYFIRLTRSETLKEKEKNYVLSARIRGVKRRDIILNYVLPNIRGRIIIAISLSFGVAILTEASLSYLGLGVQAPYPSWGSMLKESQIYFLRAPWYVIFPGLFITLTVFSSKLLGEYFREKYNS